MCPRGGAGVAFPLKGFKLLLIDIISILYSFVNPRR